MKQFAKVAVRKGRPVDSELPLKFARRTWSGRGTFLGSSQFARGLWKTDFLMWNYYKVLVRNGSEQSCRCFSATIRTGILRSFILAWSWGSRNGVL